MDVPRSVPLAQRRSKGKTNRHLAGIEEFNRKNRNPYPVSKWREVLMLGFSERHCKELELGGPVCWNELVITNQDPTRLVPRAVRELFQEDGSPIIDLDIIAPLPELPDINAPDHDCAYWIKNWGTHYQFPHLKQWKTSDWSRLEFKFNTKLFPIDEAARRLSREFPYITVELRFSNPIAGVSGHFEFRDGRAVINQLNEGFSDDLWESQHVPHELSDPETDPWQVYGLRRPSVVTLTWLEQKNIRYEEATALESMRIPAVASVLRHTKSQRIKNPLLQREVTTASLGARVLVNPIVAPDGLDQAALENCYQSPDPICDDCKKIPSRENASVAEARDIDVHIVNYLRHDQSNYDSIWKPFADIKASWEALIIKQRVLYRIADIYPQLSDAVGLILSGYKVHKLPDE